MKKPMLADDWDEKRVRFPLFVQPKIDGVRGLNQDGKLVGRSLKTHQNVHTTDYYSRRDYDGFDGELAAGPATAEGLCRDTTSAMNTIYSVRTVDWHIFDVVTDTTIKWEYWRRLEALGEEIEKLEYHATHGTIYPTQNVLIENMDQLIDEEAKRMAEGYEGLILRNPQGKHKQGRSTVVEGGLLRIKRFVEREARVKAVTEGEENMNVAQTNELGNTFRSSHKENMVPNGMVGSLECIDLLTGAEITVSAGKLTHDERIYYFKHQDAILGHVIKYKCFPIGVKDKPRFPTFQSIRAESDLDPDLAGAPAIPADFDLF